MSIANGPLGRYLLNLEQPKRNEEWELKLQEMQELCKREYPWSWSFTEFLKTHPVLKLYPTPGFFLFSLGWTSIIGGMIWMYVGIIIRYGM